MKNRFQKIKVSLKALFRGIKNILRGCWKSVLLFSLLYSFLYVMAVDSVMELAIRIGLKAAGVSYLDLNNALSVLLRPSSAAVILVAAVLLTVISLFEIAGIMYACCLSHEGKKVTVAGMCDAGIRVCVKTLKPRNWPCFLFILILMPLTGVLSLSGASIYTAIPGFVMDFITANLFYTALFGIVFSVLLFIELTFIFFLPFYILGDSDFAEACRRSRKLIRHNYLYLLLSFLSVLFIVYIAFMGLASVTSSILLNPAGFLSGANFSNKEYEEIAEYIFSNYALISDILSPGINISLLMTLFYILSERNPDAGISSFSGIGRKAGRVAVSCFTAILVLLIGFDLYTNRSNFSTLMQGYEKPQVAAHRGDSVRAPENTVPAFEMAISEETDWIELDVHETKDGVIVVSHDDDLKRVSGKKQYVHNLTYAELRDIDTGSWFSSYYSSLRLPTLDEVLKVCKGHVNLQIEIKPTKYDHDIEEKILQVINDNGMHDDVMIISLKQEPLIRIKELDPTMATGFCMVLAWGIIEDIDFADYFTVEEANVDSATVARIHNAGKKCFAWTVNSENDVQYLVDCNVDVIVTDDPVMMKDAIDKSDYNPIERFIRLYINRVTWGW